MKKILAVLAVLCLGVMVMPSIEAGESGILKMSYQHTRSALEVMIINTSDSNFSPLGGNTERILHNTTVNQTRYIVEIGRYQYDTDEIIGMYFDLEVTTVTNAGNVSVYRLLQANGNQMIIWESNWTDCRDGVSWLYQGGDYNQTPLDTLNITSTGFWQFNITNYFRTDYKWYGLIFIAESGTNISIKGTQVSNHSTWEIHYISGYGKTKALTKDIWNLVGFTNATAKNASTIFGEISNCKAISYKNSTGFYYTYAPIWGIVEDYDISYGDGLFILTTANTTWDHT